jgi:hypothetical protein
MELLGQSANRPTSDAGANLEAVRAQLDAHRHFEEQQSALAKITSIVYRKDESTKDRLEQIEQNAANQPQFYLAKVHNQEMASAIQADQDALETRGTVSKIGTQLVKTAALFSRGPVALAATIGAYALDEVHTSDSTFNIAADATLGASKGFLLHSTAERLGATQLSAATRGVALGASMRAVDVGLSRRSYIDGSGDFSLTQGLSKTFDSSLSSQALVTDAIVFGAGAGLTQGAGKMLGGALERSPVLANGFSASMFGIVGGANEEISKQLGHGKSWSSFDYGSIARSAALQGTVDFVAGIPGGLQAHTQVSRINRDFEPTAMRADLRDVPVKLEQGKVVDVFDKFSTEPTLAPEQRARVLSVLNEVHRNYMDIEAKLPTDSPERGYQIVNWKHTRNEINEVVEAARRNNLTKQQTEDALLASIFSDAVKTPSNFAVHNIDGANLAKQTLPRYFDMSRTESQTRIDGIVEAVKEHQIGPPEFMAKMIARIFIRGKLGSSATPEQIDNVESIYNKIANPLDPKNHTADGTQINFTPQEQALLESVGVKSWTVPHDSPWYKASRAVIDGDSLVNYATADGWAKIAAIRGPGKGPAFTDATVFDSLKSAEASYNDAFSVISERSKPLAQNGLQETKQSLQSVKQKMSAWLAGERTRLASEPSEVNPFNPDGSVPFWDAPLKYPKDNKAVTEGLTAKEVTQFEFAKTIREKMVDMLRQEQVLNLRGGAGR